MLAVTAPDSAAPARASGANGSATSLSVGSPNGGRLDGGARLDEAPYLRVVPFYAPSHARWGLPALVGLLDRAARRVARRYPDAVLAVGDLSRKGGGELDRHHSHESGRDADLAFFARTARNKPLVADRFVPFAPTGLARSLPGAVFDDARNWALIEALLEDPSARVTHIFVAAPLRARLLRYAEQRGVSAALCTRAAQVMMQPRHALAHDDHFHIRIACPPAQTGVCVEDALLSPVHGRPVLASFRKRSGSAAPVIPPALPGPAAGGALRARPRALPRIEGVTQVSDRPTAEPERATVQPLANASAADNVEP